MGRDWSQAALWLQVTTLELKLDAFIWALERRYRPDQPRAPKGTPEGGQWIDDVGSSTDRTDVAARRRPQRRCDGFAAGCRSGGTFGSSGFIKVEGRRYCWDCAIRYLGLENETSDEQLRTLRNFDRLLDD
jgi:hypothetical protein